MMMNNPMYPNMMANLNAYPNQMPNVNCYPYLPNYPADSQKMFYPGYPNMQFANYNMMYANAGQPKEGAIQVKSENDNPEQPEQDISLKDWIK